MGEENPIRTLRDYSKPSHEGYRNTIELPIGNRVVPLRSDTIQLVQNGCSFHRLRSKDPNQHLKDFLKLVDSLDLDGENRERTRLCLFQFSLRDQASNWVERLPAGSITIWEDLTTRFLAQLFPPGRTAKLRNDILMFQQHHGESLSKAWTRFKDLLQKCEIDRATGGKLRDKNADQSWEIIKNLALYDHEGWNDTKEFVKPVKAISTPQSTSKKPDRRLIKPEDQINFLLKGSRPTPIPSSTHIPQAYAKAVYSNPRPQNQNEPPKQNPFTFRERFLKNSRPAELLKKVLIREEAKFPITKNVNSISLTRGEEERSEKTDITTGDDFEKPTKTETDMPVKEAEKEDEAENEPNKKHRINVKLIEGLVGNDRFNDSLSGARVRKIKGKTYNLSPRGPVYEAILRKKITRKEDIGGNFKIPCNIGGLKHMNALVDQGSDVNVMPLSTYMKLTDERPAETDIKLSLASHLYIYRLGIAEDILVEVDEHVYPVDFVILDIKEDEKRPFILGTPFLTMAKAVIKFDKGTITLRSGKSKISFHRIPESLCKIERGVKNDIDHIAPTMTVNRLVLEWEERIKLHLQREMKFDQWKSKNFKSKHPALVKVEVLSSSFDLYKTIDVQKIVFKNEKEIFTYAGDGVRIHPDGVESPAIKAHLLDDKQIPSVGVFDEVFSTWIAFGGNTRDLGSFREETGEITDLHQILEEVLLTEHRDGVASIKRCRRDLFSDVVWNMETSSGRGRLKEDLESST
ncbi:MAK10-like protein [Tanacetum coccineum]